MKRLFCAAILAAATFPAFAADVGVSVTVGQPGFYGRIDIGDYPRPQLVYAEPLVIQAVPVGVVRSPIYLRVPPGHAKNWRKHCRSYGACGRPVYFVRDSWYNDVYVPRYRERHHRDHDGRRDHDDRRDWRDHDGKGHDGKKHENGHGKGHGKHD